MGPGWRIIPSLFPGHSPALFAWSALTILAAMPISFIWLRNRAVENTLADTYAWATYLSMGYVIITFGLLLLRDVGWLVVVVINWTLSQVHTLGGAEARPMLGIDIPGSENLLHFTNLAILLTALLMTVWGLYQARRKPPVVQISVPIANLPSDLEGMTIGQISDIHAGTTIKRPAVERIADALAAHNPDLIAFTGDLVDQSVGRLRNDVAPLALLRAPLGASSSPGTTSTTPGRRPGLMRSKRWDFASWSTST